MRWTELDHDRKNIVLIAVFLSIMLIAYIFSFRPTLSAISEVNRLKNADSNHLNLPQEIARLKSGINLFDSLIDTNSENYQTRLMNSMAQIANRRNTSIISIEEDAKFSNDQYEVFRIVFQGSFRSLLLTTNDIEKSYALGSLKSVNFIKETDKRTKTESLKLGLYLARIRDNNILE